jgi:ADP-ribosyl-[dinitrogen reductase] hydrolase
MSTVTESTQLKQRMTNALLGLFIGDALAMPAHWYYNTSNIPKVFDGPVDGYKTPPDNHAEAFMVGAKYHPDLEAAKKYGRKYDILHKHVKFYDTSYNDFRKSGFERDDKGVIRSKDRYHYHYGLKAGENTLNAHLVRVLIRQVIAAGKYNPATFLDEFVDYLTSPEQNNDPYTEGYIRAWFENYSKGLPLTACAASQRDNPGVNALGGLIRPMVVSLLAPDQYNASGFANEHLALTHRSENISSSLAVIIPLLFGYLNNSDPKSLLVESTKRMHLPKYTGMELFRKYNEAGGMGKIPNDVMWQLHVAFAEQSWDIQKFSSENAEKDVLKKIFSIACYPEHGVPMLLYLIWKYNFDFEKALLANVNVGGDNVHRGMVLGMLLGAMSNEIPQKLIDGLADKKQLEQEIEAYVEIAATGKGL